jgi:hypothetical protein
MEKWQRSSMSAEFAAGMVNPGGHRISKNVGAILIGSSGSGRRKNP